MNWSELMSGIDEVEIFIALHRASGMPEIHPTIILFITNI